MKKITLIRHGEASFDAPSDFERKLTPVGISQAKKLHEKLLTCFDSDRPDVFLYSGAKRTEETTLLMKGDEYSDIPMVEDQTIYEAPMKNYLTLIDGLAEELNHIVIVAHNPTLSGFCEYLAGEYISFNPSTCAVLSGEIDSWQMVSQNIFSFENIFHPKMF